MMKDRLIEIITNVSHPRMDGNITIGEWSIPQWFAEKIADELISNGITLPTFKVGDIVWVYDFMWGIVPCKVIRPYFIRCGEEGSCTFEGPFEELDIGKYVFATKEEAEAKWHAKKE